MGIVATIIFAAVVVLVLYATIRKPKDVPQQDDEPVTPQGNGGPLNPEK
jgi:hypothetical protein